MGLREIYKDKFLMGTMLPLRKYLVQDESYINLVKREFNSIATQNAFKWKNIHPLDDQWTWEYTDRFVEFGERNSMHMV
jgi:endo-1,4-beta-xylanase